VAAGCHFLALMPSPLFGTFEKLIKINCGHSESVQIGRGKRNKKMKCPILNATDFQFYMWLP